MSNPITVAQAGFRNRIYAGRSKQVVGLAAGVRKFTGDKFDVTEDACHAVAMHLHSAGESVQYEIEPGVLLTLSVQVKNS